MTNELQARAYGRAAWPQIMEGLPIASTSPFFTLDAFDGERANAIIQALELGETDEWVSWRNVLLNDEPLNQRLVEQGMKNPENRTSIQWDDATLLFTSCLELTKEGRPLTLGETLTRERFGRFPWGDGSLLGYFLDYIRPNRSMTTNDAQDIYDSIIDLLTSLTNRCMDIQRGHQGFEEGFGGLHLRGYLTAEEATLLRRNLSSRTWTASFEEPLDGGVADAAKHLLTLLKSAERRDVGVLLRSHA